MLAKTLPKQHFFLLFRPMLIGISRFSSRNWLKGGGKIRFYESSGEEMVPRLVCGLKHRESN